MTKEQLNRCLSEEKTLYLGADKKRARRMKRAGHKRYCIWRYLYYFRLSQYYNALRIEQKSGRLRRDAARILFRLVDRKRNRFGERAGVEIGLSSEIGICPDIWHSGVVINGKIGDHCILHGNNVIGNKGKKGHNDTPVIGSGVDIGAGAVLIGSIEIADECVVGAGAVVTKSCGQPGSVLVGVPAKIMKTQQTKGGGEAIG